jgi:two-component system, NarL family, sensor histidine kinase EvgS
MRLSQFWHCTRCQLVLLFASLCATSTALLVLAEVEQYVLRQTHAALEHVLLPQAQHVEALLAGYAETPASIVFRTRNQLTDWRTADEDVQRLQEATAMHWQALQKLPVDADARVMLEQALLAKPRADEGVQLLQQLLKKKNPEALAAFADTELFSAVDVLVPRLRQINAAGQQRLSTLIGEEKECVEMLSSLRLVLVLLGFVLPLILTWRALRDSYRGMASLVGFSRQTVEGHLAVMPAFMPAGELGVVTKHMLQMRDHTQQAKMQLHEQTLQHQRAQQVLEQRGQFQTLLLESAQVAIFAVDDQGVFTQINPFAERLLGRSQSALLGQATLDVIFDRDALAALANMLNTTYGEHVAEDWRALFALAKHREAPREIMMVHQRGRAFPVLLALSLMQDESTGAAGLLAVATDLTQIKRLERALRDSEARARDASQAKSAFLAAMSHEIRTPMIGVTGMIEVLGYTALDTEQRRALGVIQSSAETLLRIIGDILDFSKIEAGKMEIEPVPTSLAGLLESVAANFSATASAKGLLLKTDIDPNLERAHYADPVRLRQVLGNFLSNAIKFTEQGSVTAAIDCDRHDPSQGAMGEDTVVLRVTDTGIGVSAEAQARLFQPFSQAELDTTRKFGGTGLGLAISRRIADLMGGSIEMESAPGAGTTMRFIVSLQRAPEDELPEVGMPGKHMTGFTPRKLPSVQEAEAERSLILLVDDHATNRQVIQRQLALAGYASEVAEDGLAGLQHWRTGRYALLLSDVHMPQMDGHAMTRVIREEEAVKGLPRTPVVALTAAVLKGEAERCLDAGMDDYLTKPVGIQALGVCLQRWLPHTCILPSSIDVSSDTFLQEKPRKHLSSDALDVAASPVLCAETLEELSGGIPDEIRALLSDYFDCTDADIDELPQLLAANDRNALITQAHRIKGAARLVGAQVLADVAARLEAAIREEDTMHIPVELAALTSAYTQLKQYARLHYSLP